VDDTLRVFAGRDSSGVRGIKLGRGDEVITLSVLRHVDASVEERAAYLKVANAKRRGNGEDEADTVAEVPADSAADLEEAAADLTLSPERVAELELAEELLLTVTDLGFGKRSSAYEYRVTGRGGQGIANIVLSGRSGTEVAATFPVRPGDDVMLVTDGGRLIRVPADQVRVTGRLAMGVTLFRLNAGERVNSVFPLVDVQDESGPADDSGPADEPSSPETGPGGGENDG